MTRCIENPVVVVGIGELGGVFAKGFLKTGHPVYPVTRAISVEAVVRRVPEPETVLIAVGERELDVVVPPMPPSWKQAAALVQNELLPATWRAHGLEHPTVAVVWFEKKAGQEVKVLLPTPVYGDRASQIVGALRSIGIPAHQMTSEDELVFELVSKNLYILTINIAGLQTDGTVGELWSHHRAFAEAVARDVLVLQKRLLGQPLPDQELLQRLEQAIFADREHKCTGRSAPSRLQRVLDQAREHHVTLPAIERLSHLASAS